MDSSLRQCIKKLNLPDPLYRAPNHFKINTKPQTLNKELYALFLVNFIASI